MPCSTFSVETRLLAENPSGDNATTINLTFSQDVQVTTTDFLPFNFVTFLNDLGGCMGLWLGLGLVQTGDLVIRKYAELILIIDNATYTKTAAVLTKPL